MGSASGSWRIVEQSFPGNSLSNIELNPAMLEPSVTTLTKVRNWVKTDVKTIKI